MQKPIELPDGLFHLAADGFVSRYELARFVFDRLGMSAELHPCRTSDFVSAAARPLNSRFNCDRIKALLGAPAKPWQEPLQKFLETL